MSDITVYEHPLSPYAQKVKLALKFKGKSFSVVQPAIGAGESDFLAKSPRGEVPSLQHGENTLYHSPVICAYIDEVWPEPALLPKAPLERAELRLLEDAMDTHFEANTWALAEVQIFGRAQGARAAELSAYATQQIQSWYQWLEARLEHGGWFSGGGYGFGDMCVVPMVFGARRFDIEPRAGSPLAQWMIRVGERADVQEVIAAAVAAELDPELMQAVIASGFKREYRDHRLEWMIRAGALDIVQNGLAVDNIRFNESFVAR